MKKLILISCLISINCVASTTMDQINTIPVTSVKDLNATHPDAYTKQFIKNREQIKNKGYILSNSKWVDGFKSIKNKASHEIINNKDSSNPYDTHLKINSSEVKTAFPFEWKREGTFAYAATGGYVKEKGWSGISVYFDDPSFGICNYTFQAVGLAGGRVISIMKETTTRKINGKPTAESVRGSPEGGFLYSVNWYTKYSMSTLECVNSFFNKNLSKKLVSIATDIDSKTWPVLEDSDKYVDPMSPERRAQINKYRKKEREYSEIDKNVHKGLDDAMRTSNIEEKENEIHLSPKERKQFKETMKFVIENSTPEDRAEMDGSKYKSTPEQIKEHEKNMHDVGDGYRVWIDPAEWKHMQEKGKVY